jgi:hypothetical protein
VTVRPFEWTFIVISQGSRLERTRATPQRISTLSTRRSTTSSASGHSRTSAALFHPRPRPPALHIWNTKTTSYHLRAPIAARSRLPSPPAAPRRYQDPSRQQPKCQLPRPTPAPNPPPQMFPTTQSLAPLHPYSVHSFTHSLFCPSPPGLY